MQDRASTRMNRTQIRKIEAFALREYRRLDYSHGINHAYRTVALAQYLASREGANPEICEAAALLHQYHPEQTDKVDRFLTRIGLNDAMRNQIVHCVSTVSLSTIRKARTIEAKVVFDADKVQVLGPFGAIRQIAYRIHNRKLNFYDAATETKDLQIDVFNRLQTRTARKLAEGPHKLALEVFKVFAEWNRVSFTTKPLGRTELRA